jgi:hypothetical protein
MAEFQIIWLEEEDLDLVDKIIKNVAGVTDREGALKWALKQYAMQPDHLKLGTSMANYIPLPSKGIPHIPLDTSHYSLSMIDLAKELDTSEHTVAIASNTLERLVPDKARRGKLVGGPGTGSKDFTKM